MRHSAADILTALSVAARLVELYGEEFLPYFEAMELEAHALTARSSAMERAKAIAAKSRIADSTGSIPMYPAGYIAVTQHLPNHR